LPNFFSVSVGFWGSFDWQMALVIKRCWDEHGHPTLFEHRHNHADAIFCLFVGARERCSTSPGGVQSATFNGCPHLSALSQCELVKFTPSSDALAQRSTNPNLYHRHSLFLPFRNVQSARTGFGRLHSIVLTFLPFTANKACCTPINHVWGAPSFPLCCRYAPEQSWCETKKKNCKQQTSESVSCRLFQTHIE
jgi:hypothetical protein